jgi:hypothetical protein
MGAYAICGLPLILERSIKLNTRIMVMAAILVSTSGSWPAVAKPFCEGKAENCKAARIAAKMSPAERRFAAECVKCQNEALSTGHSVGGWCPTKCGDVYGKLWPP